MKIFLKYVLLISLLLSNFVSFAQDPGGEDSDGGGALENNDTVPINGKLIYLLIAGLLFAYYIIKVYKKNKV